MRAGVIGMTTISTGSNHYSRVLVAALAAALVAAALVVLASSPALAATSTIQDADREHTQYGNWMFTQDVGVSGGWESTTRTPGANAILKFKGTSVTWKTITYDGGGVTDVFLDGKKVASFDGYSSTQQNNVTGFSRKGLPKGKHTLKLVVTGLKRPGTFGDIFTILDRFIVDGTTIQDDSRKIAYDGWSASSNAKASGGTYRQGTSKTLGARCGMFSGSTEIDLITATGPTRGTATVRVLDISTNNSVAKEETVDLHSSTVEWQHHVPVTGLQTNKIYILEVVSADGTPVVFDGCVGSVSGRIN
jgi:hypothetical protein